MSNVFGVSINSYLVSPHGSGPASAPNAKSSADAAFAVGTPSASMASNSEYDEPRGLPPRSLATAAVRGDEPPGSLNPSPIAASMSAFRFAPVPARVCRTLLANPRKPNSANSSNSFGPSQSRRLQPSQSNASGTRSSSRTSFRLMASTPSAIAFFRASRSFGPPTSSAWATKLSSVPNCCSHFVAVFGPTPGTPGTLSVASPTSDWKSTTWAGVTPQSFSSPAASSRSFFRKLRIVTRSDRSCRQSLSLVQRNTARSRAAPSDANVAITSSASNPSTPTTGMRMASSTWRIIGFWTVSSGGGGGRWALYSP